MILFRNILFTLFFALHADISLSVPSESSLENKPKNETLIILDDLEKTMCEFDQDFEKIIWPQNARQIILENISYNLCSEIIASLIYFNEGNVRKSQRIIFNTDSPLNKLVSTHEWSTFIHSYSRAYGVGGANAYSLTEHDNDLPMFKTLWWVYPNSIINSFAKCNDTNNLIIKDNYCIATYNFFREKFFPHPYLLHQQGCLSEITGCTGSYKTQEMMDDMLLVRRKSPEFMNRVMKTLSFCVETSIDCFIL